MSLLHYCYTNTHKSKSEREDCMTISTWSMKCINRLCRLFFLFGEERSCVEWVLSICANWLRFVCIAPSSYKETNKRKMATERERLSFEKILSLSSVGMHAWKIVNNNMACEPLCFDSHTHTHTHTHYTAERIKLHTHTHANAHTTPNPCIKKQLVGERE